MQVAGILGGSAELTGRALDSDCLVEPVRGPLIPGFAAVKAAARAAGAPPVPASLLAASELCKMEVHQLPLAFYESTALIPCTL